MKRLKESYPHDAAAYRMTDRVPIVPLSGTIREAQDQILNRSNRFRSINYIYVVNSRHQLVGVVSVKEAFRAKKRTPIKKVMRPKKKLISVRAHTDKKRAAILAVTHSLKQMPVVDRHDTFLGIVEADEILRIIEQNNLRSLRSMSEIFASGHLDDVLRLSVWQSMLHRLPWLFLGLLGGLLTAGIVRGFEDTLSQNLVLAAFIPLIVYMADAIGTQMEAFIIRDLTIDPQLKFIKYITKQLLVVAMIGLVMSAIVLWASFFLYHELRVSIVLGLALFVSILTSVLSGLIIPYFFGKFRLDPANASGPVATILQDLVSVLVYFLIASLLLGT